jgi:hypothetical protein
MTEQAPFIFTATLTELEGPMFYAAIHIPLHLTAFFRKTKGAIRVLCSINGKEEFPCALNPRGNEYLIIVSKALIRQHTLAPGVTFKVAIRLDPDKGLLMPEELQEVLNQDEWGNTLFEALTPGRKRGYIYYIRTAKTVDTRLKRSFEIVEKLKREYRPGSTSRQ